MPIELPLSWSFSEKAWQKKIPVSKKVFIPWAKVPNTLCSELELFDLLKRDNPKGFILKGCRQKLAFAIQSKGGSFLNLGETAELKKGNPLKGSVMQLAARAKKKVEVKRLTRYSEYLRDLTQIELRFNRNQSLRNLFKSSFEDFDIVLAAYSNQEHPEAIVTASSLMTDKLHVELILRDVNAPVGCVELLIHELLKFNSISLGETPLNSTRQNLKLKEHILCSVLGKVSTNYNHNSLRAFKDKFNPSWQDVYWCGWPGLSMSDILRVSVSTNACSLIPALN